MGATVDDLVKEHRVTEECNPEDEITDEELASHIRIYKDSMLSRTDFYAQT